MIPFFVLGLVIVALFVVTWIRCDYDHRFRSLLHEQERLLERFSTVRETGWKIRQELSLLSDRTNHIGSHVRRLFEPEPKKIKKRRDSKSAKPGPTKIEKVEIVVTQNDNPSGVARRVVDELAKLPRKQAG